MPRVFEFPAGGPAPEPERIGGELLLAETEEFYLEKFKSDYAELPADYQTLRHIGAHIAKAGLKLAEHQAGKRPVYDIVEQVIPDLAIYRSLVVNLSRAESEPEIQPVAVGFEADAAAAILEAQGLIAYLIEPAEHGPVAAAYDLPTAELEKIAGKLHAAATALAEIYDVDLIRAQLERMAG